MTATITRVGEDEFSIVMESTGKVDGHLTADQSNIVNTIAYLIKNNYNVKYNA